MVNLIRFTALDSLICIHLTQLLGEMAIKLILFNVHNPSSQRMSVIVKNVFLNICVSV